MRDGGDELTTIDGTVAGDPSTDRAPYVNAAIVAGDSSVPIEHRADFAVITRAGERVTVELAKHPVVLPVRKLAGPWRELEAHPVRPSAAFHPDGHLDIKGIWIAPGDPICVIGYVKEHAFVPDTGGQREAPAQKVSLVRAIAIGVGDDAADDAKKAVERREREIAERAKPKAPPGKPKHGVAAAVCFALAGVLWFVEWRTGAGLVGYGLLAAVFGLMFAWCAWPGELFPGGAVDEEEITTPGVMTALNIMLLVPVALLTLGMAEGADKRNGVGAAGWVMLGVFPLIQILRGVLGKPRALAGYQIQLPASPVRRWIVVGGLIATWIAAVALAAPHMSGDGPMT